MATLALAVAFIAACGGSSSAGWTYPPAPSGAAASAAASGSGSSAAPSGGASSASPAASGASASPSAAPTSSPAIIPGPTALPQTPVVVKEQDCPDSEFKCITLGVPRDHFTAGGATWEVTFGIKRAAKERKGVFVTATGGPGISGLSSADDYTAAFAASITDQYDIVFFDQRGIGLSKPITCPDATAVYYQSSYDPTDPAQIDSAAKDTKTYVEACIAETKVDPADLPFYSTRQAVEDLEAFRIYLGVDKLALYGESYGTQYVQTYAAAHPGNVASLFVDGPVDLTSDAQTFYREEVRAFHDALTATLNDCDTDRVCRRDTAAGALAGYDALSTKLRAGPISVQFPTAKGTFVTRELTSALLDNAAAGYVYGEFDRMLFQRALTAATRGDYVPLLRAAYDSLLVDPETLVAIPDPTWSDAMYFAVTCQDYAYFPSAGDPTARLRAWADEARKLGIHLLRLSATYFGDAPCLWWPSTPATDTRVPALVDAPFTTFVLTATLDPATPIADAMRIYSRTIDAYLFVQRGGAHVLFGRGDACPDDAVSAFLGAGTLPATRITVCDGDVADAYVANPLGTAAAYTTASKFATSIEDTLLNSDDYNYRFDTDPLSLGCDHGGVLTMRAGSTGTRVDFNRCAYTPGLAMTGNATLGDDGSYRLSVRIGSQSFLYVRNEDGDVNITGTFRGKPAR